MFLHQRGRGCLRECERGCVQRSVRQLGVPLSTAGDADEGKLHMHMQHLCAKSLTLELAARASLSNKQP